MKRLYFFKGILLCLCLLTCSINTFAYEVQIGSIYYNFSGNEAEVTYKDIYNNSYSGNVVIPASVTYNSKTYSVTTIGYSAFRYCSSLTSITIPNSITSIGEEAFRSCNSLTSITIPNSVTSIGGYAFLACSGLTSITIPNSVTSIGEEAFRSCNSLTSIKVETGNTSYDSRNNCNAIIETASNTLIVGCQNTVIPNSVTSIGEDAFCHCSGLTSITIPNSVTSIGEYAFYNCIGLTSVTIGDGVTSIGRNAFSYCYYLTSVTIGNSVTTIESYAFSDCTRLKNVYCLAENVPNTASNAFVDSSKSSATLHVPSGSLNKYMSRYPWSDFGNIKSILKYTLTYILDGVVYKSYELMTYTSIVPEPAPTKEGHTFSGWSEIPETMPDHDVTVTGSFSINSYKLTYKVDGNVYKTLTVVYGKKITPEAAPTKEGYTFSGWSEIPTTMPAHDVIVTGSFAINSYKLIYKVDGNVYKTKSIAYGTAITPEPAPTKEGYTFSGWSSIPTTMPAHDVIVTGSFSINSYKLTYLLNGEEYLSETVVYGTPLTPEPAVTREGHTFSGWSEIPATMPAHDVTVTGTLTVNSYKLTYKVDGAVYKILTVKYGTAITPEPAPTKEGYTFSGWSEIPTTMPAHDVVVTGSFSVNSYKLTYKVDGNVYKTQSIAYGTAITPEPAPTKEGYTFSGWSSIPTTMPAHDVIVTGSFAINSYKLTYKVDGVVYKTSTIVYGTPITPEPAPTKEGHTFSGWSEIPATMPAHDVTITGTFGINGYTLTYLVDGEIYKTYTLNYGINVTPEPAPTKEGYTFSGWSSIPTTMPAENVIVTGSFTINQYILAYILDGEAYKSYKLDYNTPIKPESMPVKKGMTFSGWGDVPETMPAHDVTLTGSYSWSKETLDGVTYQVTDTLNNYASVIGFDNISGDAEILPAIETGGDTYTVNIIVNNAFKGCTSLTSITISGNVTSIGSYAFSGCSSLSSVTIGKGVTLIGNNAFSNTSPKKVFWLPNTPPNGYQNLVGAVNYVANDRYSYLTNVVVYPYLSSMFEVDDVKYVPVSPSERTCDVIDCAYSIENLNIGETVTNKGITLTIKNIGPYFCYDNTFIKEITINNQGGIGQRAFDGCSVLQTVELGQGITSINNRAFANCTSITEIQIPKKVSTIEDYVFSGCTGLKTVHVDISRYELNLGSNGSNPLFADCPLDSVYIGRDITYPTTSNKGYSPFYRNTTLRLLTIADNETDISAYEFYGCTNLKSVRIGDGMTTISDRAFTGCSSLEYFAFGFNVRTIGKEVFSDCTALSRLISRAIIPPTCGAQALDDINKWECTLIVPQNHIAAYQQADQWKEFFFIEGGDFDDGIGNVKSEIATGEDWYDLNGRKLAAPQKGINIIRYSDGSSRKVLLK